jgi:hypothetical protein
LIGFADEVNLSLKIYFPSGAAGLLVRTMEWAERWKQHLFDFHHYQAYCKSQPIWDVIIKAKLLHRPDDAEH